MSPPWMTKLEIPAVKSLMRVFPQALSPSEPAALARRMMREDNLRYLPVEDGGSIVGMISESDLPADADPATPIAELMTRDPLVVDLNQPVDAVLLEMSRRHLDAALVTRGEHLAGVFTALDACRGFARLLQHRAGRVEEDDGVA